jgi:hypothetical protein
MMIKVSNEFLDFDDLIEVEKQIKLIEEIATTDGDFSYSFELQKTIHNTRLLGNPFPDNVSKLVYQQIPAQLLNDSGAETFNGYLRIEKVTNVYECSFFAGNNNWFGMIDGLLSDLNLSQYDVAQTEANIVSSWSNTEGVVFPLVDNGSLLTRSHAQTKIEDYIGGFYIKTIFERVFIEAGIKIQGELLNDWVYHNAIFLKNSKNQTEIDNRSSYVNKDTPQAIVAGVGEDIVIVTWDDDTTYPYFDGSQNNFNLAGNRYTADVKMVVNVSAFLEITSTVLGSMELQVFINGVYNSTIGTQSEFGDQVLSGNKRFALDAGDYIEIYVEVIGILSSAVYVNSGTVKITPTYIYKTFGVSTVPNWTKQEFVSNVLRMFNVLASYQASNNTLTLNLFEKIKSKTPIDLSPYISSTEIDYTDFISNYGQRSKLSYNQVDFEELKSYNQGKFFPYGTGVIEVDNDFLEPDVDIVESDFSNPVGYINAVFDMSMERLNLIELSEGDSFEFTGVTDSSGVARIAIPEDVYLVGDLVRVDESVDPAYNGDWVVAAIGAGWVELTGLAYSTSSTGNISKLEYDYSNGDDVFLFINVPLYPVPYFSGNPSLLLETSVKTSIGFAYFDLINTGRQVNQDFIYSLSFGGIDSPLQYQVTMTEQQFRLLGKILNDPVKLLSEATLPYHIYLQLDFLSPITIRTEETTNEYILNRITGYKESYYPCTLELIKI